MFSTGEIIVLLGMAGLLIGPKELPMVARGAGRLTGRAAAFLSRSRAAFLKFSDDNEITELHKEMQQSLAQLRQIQHELRSGMNVLDPGPLARKAMALSQQPAAKSGGSGAGVPQTSPSSQASLRPAAALAASEHLPHSSQGVRARAPVFESLQQEIERLQQLEQRSALLQAHTSGSSRLKGDSAQTVGSAVGKASRGGGGPPDSQTGSTHEQSLGISAVSLGRAPDRSDALPTGADIALDALAEEEVAHSVRDLLEQHSKPPDRT